MEILIVGSYCHDTLIKPDGSYELLGGTASYVSTALRPLNIDFDVVSRVGLDFLYDRQVSVPSLVSSHLNTARFIEDQRFDPPIKKIVNVCEPIYAADILKKSRAKIGIAGGVALELTPEALLALKERVDFLICDIQALIRRVDSDGNIYHVKISETPFYSIMSAIDLLKANTQEALFLDVPPSPTGRFVITEGARGCRLIEGTTETRIAGFPAEEVDPTGAGDSLIAGLAVGLLRQMDLPTALQLGNLYGSHAVQYRGIPNFASLTETPLFQSIEAQISAS